MDLFSGSVWVDSKNQNSGSFRALRCGSNRFALLSGPAQGALSTFSLADARADTQGGNLVTENKRIEDMTHAELRDAIEHYRENHHESYTKLYRGLKANGKYRQSGFHPTTDEKHARLFLTELRSNANNKQIAAMVNT